MQHTGDSIIDDVIKTIESQISEKFPDRSKIQNEIATKTDIFVRPPRTLAESVLEQLWGQFLQVYNRTIGIQHHCDTFDIGEILVNDDKIDMVISENLTQSTLQALAMESWMDFGKIFNKLSRFRNKWLFEVWKLEDKHKHSCKDARVALDELVTQILREYKIKPTFQDVVELVGRGTSTSDGISIARAVLEYFSKNRKNGIGPKVLFATHYFELTELAGIVEGIKNYNVCIKEWQDEIVFIHKVVPGPSDKSYGIHVAKLAGLPENVINRAKTILIELETNPSNLYNQPSLFQNAHPLQTELTEIDTDKMTPLEALEIISNWKKRYEK